MGLEKEWGAESEIAFHLFKFGFRQSCQAQVYPSMLDDFSYEIHASC